MGEAPVLLIMGIFITILVISGYLYSISEFTRMKEEEKDDEDEAG